MVTERQAIARFQGRRWCALAGSALPALTLLFALLNGKVHVVAGLLAWSMVGASVLFAVWAFARYRCPACGRFPEAEIPAIRSSAMLPVRRGTEGRIAIMRGTPNFGRADRWLTFARRGCSPRALDG